MNQENVLSVKNLNKIYLKNRSKSVHALKNLNLEVKEGEIFGLLGPNGAGKSTFINILAGTTIKTSGNVNVWGFNLDKNPQEDEAQGREANHEIHLRLHGKIHARREPAHQEKTPQGQQPGEAGDVHQLAEQAVLFDFL